MPDCTPPQVAQTNAGLKGSLTLRMAVALTLCVTSLLAPAQPFPSRPVRIIVGFPPGGGTDIVARTLSPRLSEALGQPVVIDNRGGASGLVATELAAKSAPDGYTLFMGTLGNLSVNPLLFPKIPFDVARDFAPVTQVVSVTFMLYVHPSLPVKTVRQLIVLAKERAGQLNYASSGSGGAPHLAAELFNSLAGVKLVCAQWPHSARHARPCFQTYRPYPRHCPAMKSSTGLDS
jgi:tripartite-type tricarboxylate transporter receptor subunit TctC